MHIVVDTNIWLLNPNFYETFKDEIIVIPQAVIEELDSKKTSFGVLGLNARQSIKKISEIAKHYQTNEKIEYVELDKYKFMIMRTPSDKLNEGLIKDIWNSLDNQTNINDNKIIACAFYLSAKYKNIMLLSNDCNVRTKVSLSYNKYQVKTSELIDGEVKTSDYYNIEQVDVTDDQLDKLYNGFLTINDLDLSVNTINTPLYLCTRNNIILAMIKHKGQILPLKQGKKNNCFKIYGGVKPLNDCQKQFVNMIKDNEIKIIGCIGKTGSGKTLIALSTALQLLDDGEYSHIKLIKPYVSLGNTVGLLPGSLDEKVAPIKESFNSALECMGLDLDELEHRGVMSFNVTEYERGKTYVSSIVIVDEAQNLSSMEIKSLITRCGETSKIILLGDTKQIDSLYLSENYNGLSYVIDRLNGQDFFGAIYLNKSERAKFIDKVDDLL